MMIAHDAPTLVRYGHGEVWLTGTGAIVIVTMVLMVCFAIFLSGDR